MIHNLKPYPAYKDSGVPWLGKVPAHWEVRRVKTLCTMESGDGITAISIDPVGAYPVYGGNGMRGYTSNYTHDGNFVLIGRQGALCGNVHIVRGRFWASEHAVVATAHSGYSPGWLGAILGVMNLNQYSIAAAQPGLSVERVLNLQLPVPPFPEQTAIVRFLDHADRRIRRYIRAKQKLSALLEEQKQAIQEGFILDVLAHYTPVNSYYKLAKTVADDPQFDTKKAQKKLRRFVEGHDHAIRLKAEIMVDHFHEQVLAQNKIGGAARAMVVTNGIERAIQYFYAIRDYLKERKSRYEAIVAFSGEPEFNGAKVSEASLNGFPSGKIAEKIQEDPYRFLVCADKFQTGYDEPLLHTMYVDKTLAGIKAVQTLSRLNRAHPKKHDVFVLDFLNKIEIIRESFADFYRATMLADETDPNKLHDLQADLDGAQVYSPEQIGEFVSRYLSGAERDQLDPILDDCVAIYLRDLDEDGQVDFKGKAKGFVRTYGFLSSVLPYTNAAWEKRSIFLNFLVSKLPSPQEKDLSKGILDAIDMDSYRAEKQAIQKIMLPDEDAEVEPVPAIGGGHLPEPELDRLSNILRAFNDLFGDIYWDDADRVRQLITETIPSRVAEDTAFKNAQQNSDKENTRIEHDKALLRVMTSVMKDDTELFKQFMDNQSFKRWLTDTVFGLAYEQASTG